MQDSNALHVVLGSGQIGSRLALHLRERGHRVRVVQRTAAQASAGIERLHGDVTDLAFAERACAGASVVYDCMNPPYDQWPRHLLALGRGSLHGAVRAGAKLVALDCLYMYGRPSGPMTEQSPRTPCSRKGVLRVELEALRMEALGRGDVRVAIGRASDFLGPAMPNTLWSPRFFERIFAGKAGECTGDPDQPHSYTFADDVVRGLTALGESADADGVWHLPTPPAETTRALASRIGRAVGVPNAAVSRVPGWLLKGAGVFSPMMRELAEMTYQWEAPFVMDDSKFVRAFGFGATSMDDAVAATAAWALERYGARAA